MTLQSEKTLENNLLTQLESMDYERITIADEMAMVTNLRTQLELHNETTFSDIEFERILNHLNKGGVFDRAQTLREKMSLVRDDNTHKNIEFLNMSKWCRNRFQVTNQITQQGEHKNRYDVTILINGLPLVHIELKRRGIELKEAFNQVNRYRRHSFSSNYGLYQYVQLFVISNGGNTKYYSNTVGYANPDKKESFKFTSFWADKDNNKITELEDFTRIFLEKCHIAKMITKYMVLTTNKKLLALRPYQYYAVEAIVDKVANNGGVGGYIWHTTGSGKTLTSFKASQIIVENPDVHKVVFVVDRNDLDNQTIKEFNSFKKDSVDTTTNTKTLVKQFTSPDTKLIVTTIQKLNTAITRERHTLKMDVLRDKKIVFIFDECHRSQFGETHKKITQYFNSRQLFGFTGTPIFVDNASGNTFGKRTTKDLFGECLHKYVITDAIRDENVLKFSVEYVGKYHYKDGSANEVDIEVEDIDRRELMESSQRLEKIADYIIANHSKKTHSRDFTAIFAISNVDTLIKYYDLLQKKKEAGNHNLRIATIFSYGVNEEDKDADSMLDDDPQLNIFEKINQHSRDKLESFIADYNQMFGTSYSTKDSDSFYNYYRNIADRVKAREIDILLVVNMFLTGFDSKSLNTLYVDKNLRFHGLVQAYSRTNRILNETKSQGNVVVFRNLKKATDEALELFANKNAREEIFIEPYETYQKRFNEAVNKLRSIALMPEDVDKLDSEDEELAFVQAFREIMRLKNILVTFADFKFADTTITEQTFENYKGKYLDIYDKVKREHEKEKVSILDDVDFELELVRRDEVNVSYILRLIARMVGANEEKQRELSKTITDTMAGDTKLRSKRELIEKFIQSSLPNITDGSDVETEFFEFWSEEQVKEFRTMCEEEGLDGEKTQALLDRYVSSGRIPRDHELDTVLAKQPSVLQRNSIISKIKTRLTTFIETFIEGV
jgi:type I restriction enzyme R subunit